MDQRAYVSDKPRVHMAQLLCTMAPTTGKQKATPENTIIFIGNIVRTDCGFLLTVTFTALYLGKKATN